MSLVTAQLMHALSCRSPKARLWGPQQLPPNPYLVVALGASLGLQFLTVAIPGLRHLLQLSPLNWADSAVIAGSVILPLLVSEATKPNHHHDGVLGALALDCLEPDGLNELRLLPPADRLDKTELPQEERP
jgi:hypothetical protein